jgi:hypothetical protein
MSSEINCADLLNRCLGQECAKPVHPLVLFQTLRSFGTAQSS